MEPHTDYYAVLGVTPGATQASIQQAYRELARRFHPEANADENAAEEFKQVSAAYALLSDAQQRSEYDRQRANTPGPFLNLTLTPSRKVLPAITEPQVVYALLEIHAARADVEPPRAPLNVCIVVDRSTSMKGPRLDQVKAALQRIIEQLEPEDIFSVVDFSDQAQVLVPAKRRQTKNLAISKVSTLHARGGTQILQGLVYGLAEVHRNLSPLTANHLVLLTDGRTYGDEDDCLLLAGVAAGDGIAISGFGIGDEWNDVLLDRLANVTGGTSTYVESPEQVSNLLHTHVRQIGGAFAEMLQVRVAPDSGVTLQSACKLSPGPQPLDVAVCPFRLGTLPVNGTVALLLQFMLEPLQPARYQFARMSVMGNVLGATPVAFTTAVDFGLAVQAEVDNEAPPLAIAQAVSKLILYRMQQKAWKLASSGEVEKATQILETLAARLLASGEEALGRTALTESKRLRKAQAPSPEAQKRLKYGTRALILPTADLT